MYAMTNTLGGEGAQGQGSVQQQIGLLCGVSVRLHGCCLPRRRRGRRRRRRQQSLVGAQGTSHLHCKSLLESPESMTNCPHSLHNKIEIHEQKEHQYFSEQKIPKKNSKRKKCNLRNNEALPLQRPVRFDNGNY